MRQWAHEWLVLAHGREHCHMAILSYGPIWFKGGALPMVSWGFIVVGTVICEYLVWAHQNQCRWYREGRFLMRQWAHEWLVLAHGRENGHMAISSYRPIWFKGGTLPMVSWGFIVVEIVDMRMARIGSLWSVSMVSWGSLLDAILYTRMTRSGSRSGAWQYGDNIVWAYLIQGGTLPIVSWGLIGVGTVDTNGSFWLVVRSTAIERYGRRSPLNSGRQIGIVRATF